MMESEEAIMENENNSNLESESINRDREGRALQDFGLNSETSLSVPEENKLNFQPDSTENIDESNDVNTYHNTTEEDAAVDSGENIDLSTGEAEAGTVQTDQGTPMLPDKTDTTSDTVSNFCGAQLQNDPTNVHANSPTPERKAAAQFDQGEQMEEADKSQIETEIGLNNYEHSTCPTDLEASSVTATKTCAFEENELNEMSKESGSLDSEVGMATQDGVVDTIVDEACADLEEKNPGLSETKAGSSSEAAVHTTSNGSPDDLASSSRAEDEDDLDLMEYDSAPQSNLETEPDETENTFPSDRDKPDADLNKANDHNDNNDHDDNSRSKKQDDNDKQDVNVSSAKDDRDDEKYLNACKTLDTSERKSSSLSDAENGIDNSAALEGSGEDMSCEASEPQTVEMRTEEENSTSTQDVQMASVESQAFNTGSLDTQTVSHLTASSIEEEEEEPHVNSSSGADQHKDENYYADDESKNDKLKDTEIDISSIEVTHKKGAETALEESMEVDNSQRDELEGINQPDTNMAEGVDSEKDSQTDEPNDISQSMGLKKDAQIDEPKEIQSMDFENDSQIDKPKEVTQIEETSEKGEVLENMKEGEKVVSEKADMLNIPPDEVDSNNSNVNVSLVENIADSQSKTFSDKLSMSSSCIEETQDPMDSEGSFKVIENVDSGLGTAQQSQEETLLDQNSALPTGQSETESDLQMPGPEDKGSTEKDVTSSAAEAPGGLEGIAEAAGGDQVVPERLDSTSVENAGERETPENAADNSSKAESKLEDTSRAEKLIEARNIKQEILTEEDATTTETSGTAKTQAEILRDIKTEAADRSSNDVSQEMEEDVVVLDDDGESFPVKKELTLQQDKSSDSSLKISSVSGEEHSLHEQAAAAEGATGNITTPKTEKEGTTKKSKSKTQVCIVCLKVCRCKYNIVRNGDIKHLCGDDCFKRFRKTPSSYLKNTKGGKTTETPQPKLATLKPPPTALNDIKTCTVCQLMNVNPSQPFCNWKGLDFCGEACLGKFQANLSTSCSFCRAHIPLDMRATFCLKIGNDMRPFCQQRCYNEFKKNLRLCAYCQKDLSSIPKAFSAMVGSLDKKIRQFCSQACCQKLEAQMVNVEVVSLVGRGAATQNNSSLSPGSAPHNLSPRSEVALCSVCQKRLPVQHTVRFQGKVNRMCSSLCLSAFQYTNKIGMSKCDSCGTVCTAEEAQAHFVQFEGQVKRFCSDACVNQFRRDNNKIVSCCWCAAKKMNFDMIERLDAENKFQLFCSLNCLSLYRVNLQAKSNQAVPCDQCKMVTPAQYHLTMSDASVRNFCSYTCVMAFQAQFTAKPIPATQTMFPGQIVPPIKLPPPQKMPVGTPKEQIQPASKGRGRMSTRQASKQQSPSFPVISNVVSLAAPAHGKAPEQTPAAQPASSPQQTSGAGSGKTLSSGDGKHQIIIQAPPVKPMRNKSLQCWPLTMTKATSCRPHSQSKENQTEEIPDKQVLVPIPVPIYIPMPTVMYSAPTPVPVPFPIPIPVPVFIPTTRKSAAGILKTITDIVERMPSDPLEAELLMMAEAVASDKIDSDSDSEPEADFGAGYDDEPEEPLPADQRETTAAAPASLKKKEGQGEEDMIQMALRMAEEMSGPVEDLESSVEPVAVNTDPPSHLRNTPTQVNYTQADEDYVPPGTRGRGRGAKRASRGRPPGPRAKRQRAERSYTEEEDSDRPQTMTPQPAVPQQVVEPAADASYRLKFTYGVNAWRHWVIAKNAQIENTKTVNSIRPRAFPTDILKCTTDELNFSLIFFIQEVRKPNGEEYSPDSIYYLCLGIQQYLYENGRIDSIFTDSYFDKFADSLHSILRNLQPKVNAQGQMLCRIEEEHLWESKQLGAHSPFVLLNTLIYFHTKHFILKTAQEHMSLSFAQILKHWKKGAPFKGQATAGKNISLRFYCLANGKKEGLAARKNKEGVPVYEITENFENPLRCPVKLYEFFLSKCPESIKNRNDIFYPVPERSCVPDSPVWYSTQSIGLHTMDKMLTRVLLVREIQESHLHAHPIYL